MLPKLFSCQHPVPHSEDGWVTFTAQLVVTDPSSERAGPDGWFWLLHLPGAKSYPWSVFALSVDAETHELTLSALWRADIGAGGADITPEECRAGAVVRLTPENYRSQTGLSDDDGLRFVAARVAGNLVDRRIPAEPRNMKDAAERFDVFVSDACDEWHESAYAPVGVE